MPTETHAAPVARPRASQSADPRFAGLPPPRPAEAETEAGAGLRRADPAARRAVALADAWTGLPDGVTRWRLAAALRGAARPLGLSDAMLRLIEHYVDLSYDQDWDAESEPVICRPVVEVAEAMGLGERQVRNLERALVERGLLAFRDSGNHHRRGRRDRRTGRLIYAYGPSLAPLGTRAAEIIALAEQARAEIAAARRARLAISALRRRLRVELIAAEAAGIDAEDVAMAAAAIPERMPAGTSATALAAARATLDALAQALTARLGDTCPPTEIGDIAGQPAISSRQLPDTSTSNAINGNSIVDDPRRGHKTPNAAATPPSGKPSSDHGVGSIPLALALAAAGPLIGGAARTLDGPTGWRSLIEAARLVAPLLGIDHALWGEACGRLGRGGAALATIMLERGMLRTPADPSAAIRVPDAYLRGMLTRAETGALHLDRSIRALAARPQPSSGARSATATAIDAGSPP